MTQEHQIIDRRRAPAIRAAHPDMDAQHASDLQVLDRIETQREQQCDVPGEVRYDQKNMGANQ